MAREQCQMLGHIARHWFENNEREFAARLTDRLRDVLVCAGD